MPACSSEGWSQDMGVIRAGQWTAKTAMVLRSGIKQPQLDVPVKRAWYVLCSYSGIAAATHTHGWAPCTQSMRTFANRVTTTTQHSVVVAITRYEKENDIAVAILLQRTWADVVFGFTANTVYKGTSMRHASKHNHTAATSMRRPQHTRQCHYGWHGY